MLLSHAIMLTSCTKDPLTRPAKVHFLFGMTDYALQEDKSQSASKDDFRGPFVMNRGTLVISSIEFEGRREQGEDVFFTSNPGQAIVADLGDETMNTNVHFDIPQGIYHHMEIILHLGTDEHPALVLHGSLQRGPFEDIPVRFEYRFSERIRITGKGQNQQNVVLREDNPSTARIELDVESVFRLVHMGMIMSASTVQEGGQNIILIDNASNLPIFNMTANRITNAFTMVID